jgi:hypothetical protein
MRYRGCGGDGGAVAQTREDHASDSDQGVGGARRGASVGVKGAWLGLGCGACEWW